jgi:hypothetical protein
MATNNAVNVGLSGSTGTGNFVGATSPTLVTPTIGAASATSVTFTSTTGIVGTTTNDSAAAGSVGQLISSTIATGSAVSLTTATAKDVTSISLTAGDWDIAGNVYFTASVGAQQTSCWSSTTSATAPDNSLINGYFPTAATTGQAGIQIPFSRISIASTTTLYLSCVATFAGGTVTACGGIFARRRR